MVNVQGGTAANDILLGTDAPDVIEGLDGNDLIFGRRDNDVLRGDDGNDLLFGGRTIKLHRPLGFKTRGLYNLIIDQGA